LDREQPIVVIAEPGREYEAQMRLGRIGFERVAGYLESGMQALASRAELVAQTERVSPEELVKEFEQASLPSGTPFLLDVRSPREWNQARIEGSVNIPLNHLQERISEVPHGRRIVVCCASGYRASIAASLLKRHGFHDLADLSGGLNAWHATQPAPQAGQVDGR
jgi:rhodanese-related sulfurtransferase